MYDTEYFIKLIELEPAIWDSTKEIYNNKAEKSKSWGNICYKLFPDYPDKDVEKQYEIVTQLKRRWKSLRDSYTREVGRLKRSSGAEARKPYVHFNNLDFLHPVVSLHNRYEYKRKNETGLLVGDGSRSADDSTNIDDVQSKNVPILGDIWSSQATASIAAHAATSTLTSDDDLQQSPDDLALTATGCTSDDLWQSNPPPDLWNVTAEVEHVNDVVDNANDDNNNRHRNNRNHYNNHNNDNNIVVETADNNGYHRSIVDDRVINHDVNSNSDSISSSMDHLEYDNSKKLAAIKRSDVRSRWLKEISSEEIVDGDKLFMMSLVPDLKAIPHHSKFEAKCEIMNTLKKFKRNYREYHRHRRSSSRYRRPKRNEHDTNNLTNGRRLRSNIDESDNSAATDVIEYCIGSNGANPIDHFDISSRSLILSNNDRNHKNITTTTTSTSLL